LICEKGRWGDFESELLSEFKKFDIPVIAVFNKTDLFGENQDNFGPTQNKDIRSCHVSALKKEGFGELKSLIITNTPQEFSDAPAILSDLVRAGEAVVLVVPIDKEAPKGRLILPQVQSIRELLDADSVAVVCKERELGTTLNMLKEKPGLVVTDSQAFLKVAGDTPEDVMMTSFSILFARYKADLAEMVKGAMAIDTLKGGDRVLISESCTHHPITDDIGTVKIPRWLNQYVGGKIEFEHSRGYDFSDELAKYKLIIHCGGCMWNRRQMLSRIMLAKEANVPITNYGLTIAYTLGIFERALRPFGYAYQVYEEKKSINNRSM
jgi:[FeFe] hydrogenase H-cluster maturation GTPase HydF